MMQKLSWQQELQQAITSTAELLEILAIDPKACPNLLAQPQQFPLLVPRSFVARMQKNNLNDPLLRQVLPVTEEEKIVAGFGQDPLEENKLIRIPGLLHKYHGRVLITLSDACAINCRFCFRRYFLYQKPNLALAEILSYLANDKKIYEVILSGGEPLLLNDQKLKSLFVQLAALKHIKYLRIHSRLPIVMPSRITDEFIKCFTSTRLQSIMVMHCNHPNEIDSNVANAMQRLKQANITLLNQSVLLKDINDSASTLIELNNKLFNLGALPYYLHLLDKVQGAAHFKVTKKTARLLIKELLRKLPGYLVPKLVVEQANTAHKIPLAHFNIS